MKRAAPPLSTSKMLACKCEGFLADFRVSTFQNKKTVILLGWTFLRKVSQRNELQVARAGE